MGLVGQQERDAKMGTVRDLREDVGGKEEKNHKRSWIGGYADRKSAERRRYYSSI